MQRIFRRFRLNHAAGKAVRVNGVRHRRIIEILYPELIIDLEEIWIQ